MKNVEFVLDNKRKIILGDNLCFINIEKSLPDKLKKIVIEYNEICRIKFIPREVNWIASFFYFVIMTVFEVLGNPISGTEARIEIFCINEKKIVIEVDSVNMRIIKSTIKEIRRRIKSKPSNNIV